jgi:hypothetical protein
MLFDPVWLRLRNCALPEFIGGKRGEIAARAG